MTQKVILLLFTYRQSTIRFQYVMMTTDVFNLDAFSTGKQYETDIYFWK
jgi:hypothetical protein